MTQNQIAYWNLQESKRHNVVGEGETNRHNVATENETNRHNIATEQISISDLQERQRHNLESERLGRDTLAETNRHNMAGEGETYRHNLATENISQQQVNVSRDVASEQARHNVATERETGRHNVSTEQIQFGGLSETQRHNLREEMLKGYDLNIKQQGQTETKRHNIASEKNTQYSNVTQRRKAEADAAVANANLEIQKWNQADKSRLTDAQIRQVDSAIDKMRQDITESKVRNVTSVWQQVNNSANAVAKIIDAFIPF